MSEAFTLLHPEGRADVRAHVDGQRVFVAPEAVRDALGWKLEDEGLCRGDVCVPVRNREALVGAAGLDLAELGQVLGLPVALDAVAGAAAVGTPDAARAEALDRLEAPDFRLPDLSGKLHTLSEHRGKKVLLIAYASW